MATEMMALDKIKDCLSNGHDFVLQGGAGCGKTETLKQLIDYISTEYPYKKIACITHTNKAADEISSRVEGGHVVSTIHSFLNGLIKDYKKNIHQVIYELFKVNSMVRLELEAYADEKEQRTKEHDKYKKVYEKYSARYYIVFGNRTEKVEGKKLYDTNPVEFNRILNEKILEINNKIKLEIEQKGFKSIEYNETRFNDFKKLTFGHDGLLDIAALLFDEFKLLGKILNDKFDYIFIDEYQDTHEKIVDIFLTKLPLHNKPVIGLFGDSMQSIYGDGIGNVNHFVGNGVLKRIDKEDNFRCSPQVIKFINTLRNDGLNQALALKTMESADTREGTVEFNYSIHDNKPNAWSSDVEKEAYTSALNTLIELSAFEGEAKILLLSNKAVAVKAGFPNLYKVFSDRYLEPKEEFTKILTRLQLLDLFEICNAYEAKNYNFVLSKLKKSGLSIKTLADKENISASLQSIISSNKGAVDTVENAFALKLLKRSETFSEYKNRAEKYLELINSDGEYLVFEADYLNDGHTLPKMQKKKPEIDEDTFRDQERNLKQKQFFEALFSDKVTFLEVLNYFKYEDEQTPYITMHKTKGTGIDNVLVVLDEYFWNEYDFCAAFNQNEENLLKKEKNLQLIYVACSRAKFNLRCVRLVSSDEEAIFAKAFEHHHFKKVNIEN
ncbi:MAG: ATP-dependent helicase [Methylotenera sp.]|nr:ATP-dependent helicase [Methylotenera sp.]